mmetsp:Transcript_16998/g.27116  ORF Transcript_16998/g.27116 Transcript_16998/m.27116 type:complete len:92 (+) Transcript_16998:483-758(+)
MFFLVHPQRIFFDSFDGDVSPAFRGHFFVDDMRNASPCMLTVQNGYLVNRNVDSFMELRYNADLSLRILLLFQIILVLQIKSFGFRRALRE